MFLQGPNYMHVIPTGKYKGSTGAFSATTSGHFVISEPRNDMAGKWKCVIKPPRKMVDEEHYILEYETQLTWLSLFCG